MASSAIVMSRAASASIALLKRPFSNAHAVSASRLFTTIVEPYDGTGVNGPANIPPDAISVRPLVFKTGNGKVYGIGGIIRDSFGEIMHTYGQKWEEDSNTNMGDQFRGVRKYKEEKH